MKTPQPTTSTLLKKLGLERDNPGAFCGEWLGNGPPLQSVSPIDGRTLASIRTATPEQYEQTVQRALAAFGQWQTVPAPKRGDLIRQLGQALRDAKPDLGRLVTLEAGKILAEGEGEVQEMIDICDFALGLARQLYGLTIASERPQHRMLEQWHPLGVVGIVTAFNFPVAVWSWNSALAAVCGDATLWKPSSQTPLTAIATIKIAERLCRANGVDPAIFSLVIGSGATVGERLINDPRLPLISATGSTKMGRHVGEMVARRLGRSLLELGGNNAIIVAPSADLDLATRAILFGAVGTAGQRCTTTRRILVHESVREDLTRRLIAAYKQVPIGSPLEPGTLMGPLINRPAVADMQAALAAVRKQGGQILYGGEPLDGPHYPGGCYVRPCLVAARHDLEIVREETFAPILYLTAYRALDEAIAWHNEVPQGLELGHLYQRSARGRAVPLAARQRLRHCQCQPRHQRRRNRRRLRRRERDRRRPGERQRRLEGLHAPPDGDDQLLKRPAAGAGDRIRLSARGARNFIRLTERAAG